MNVIELRQYRMKRGRHDEFIELFERCFIDSQQAHGMGIFGPFRVAGDPYACVWIRTFKDMESRREALSAFYDGPVWAEHRNAANATMNDVSNVLLLQPDSGDAPPSGDDSAILVTVRPRGAPARDLGGELLGTFVSLHAENSYPRLPIREGEDVRVTFHRFPAVARVPAVDGEHVVLLPTARPEVATAV